jgi:hypothetical protein
MEIKLITSRLEGAGIAYCVVGGLASIAYGRPRLTLDADLVVAIQPQDVVALRRAFPPKDFYLPPTEVLLAEMSRENHGHFNILHQRSALRADCYLPGNSALTRWELAHRRWIESPFGAFWFSPPEAVIAHKLLFYREGGSGKHVEDIRGILASGAVQDSQELLNWIDRLDLQAEWQIVHDL